MALVKLPIVGPTYTNRSLPVSAQVTRNFYIEVNEPASEIIALLPFPGCKSYSTAGTGLNRGMGKYKGRVYTVSGNELYLVDSDQTTTLLGTINGTNRCTLTDDGINLVITIGSGKPYTWDGTTLTQGTDNDLPNANTGTFINRRMVYDGIDGDIAFADLDAPLSVNSANVAIEESFSDDTVAVIAHRQQIYVFGTDSLAPWYAIESGNPPYSRITNAVQQIGLEAIHSVASNKDYIYFLANDLQPYRVFGLDVQPIGNPAIGQAIRKYVQTDNAFGVCFGFDTLRFYLLSFPNGNETWLYNEQSGQWTNLAYKSEGAQHLISDYVFAYNKHLVADRRNGNIYELDFDTFTDNSDIIQRRRETVSLGGDFYNAPGRRIFMNSLELIIEPGASLVTTKADIIMQYSDNNGRTWSGERWSDIGEQGDYEFKLTWLGLGYFYTRMFRFTMTDPIKWVIVKAYADVESGNV